MADTANNQLLQHTTIGERYRLVRKLGWGGMATVYEAVDEATGRRVAVKQLHSHRATGDGQMARLFEMEFHTLTQLIHPRVVAVYDYQALPEGAFYTMELLDGGDLREHTTLPWKVICALLCDVCSALSLLHSRRFVHRDVTPRNIRRTRDGKAKLIDFGAMVPFGTHKRAVGTPAFTAPEVVMGQSLDGRTDLYSVGATAYLALTGRYAYSARTFDALRNAWRSRPPLPSHYNSEVPPDLDQLVMSLLNLQPSRRPASAGAVIERLTAVAGLRLEEQLQVQRSYLTTPSLVGRDNVLREVRRQMIQAARGSGTSIFLTGARGVGISRMVDACALEGKLASGVVLRVDAGDAQEGDWSGVRSLLEQLITELPTKVVELLVDHAAVIAHIWPRASELTSVLPRVFSQPQEIRAAVQNSLLNLMQEIARRCSLVVTVDDIDRMDEPTCAFIALLAQEVHGRRMVVVTAASNEAVAAGIPGVHLLLGEESTIALQPLSRSDTERLLVSVFGEVPNVRLLASRLHELSSGLPATVMQITQHLLDQDIVRFHEGGWLLPAAIDGNTLPAGVSDMIRATIASLDDTSVELAQGIALSRKAAVTVEECGRLLERPDLAEVLRVLDRLVLHRVLRVAQNRYVLSQPAWEPLLIANLEPENRQKLHARVAEMFLKTPDAELSAAEHLLACGNAGSAIDQLLSYGERVRGELREEPSRLQKMTKLLPANWKYTMETALEAAEQLSRSRGQRLSLKLLLLENLAVTAQLHPDISRNVVKELVVDSGLKDYEELSSGVPLERRLACALERARARYDATSEADRGLPLGEAIAALARVYVQIIGMTAASANVAHLQELPSLEPFATLSPAVAVVQLNVQGTCSFLLGQFEQAHELYLQILSRMAEPGGIGLVPSLHRYMELAIIYAVAQIEILIGLTVADERIEILEHDSLFEVNAQSLRVLRALMNGDVDTADACKRSSELLKIRNPANQIFEGGSALFETLAHIEIGDVARLRQMLEPLNTMAAKYQNWVAIPMLVQGHVLRLRGDFVEALELFSKALSRARLERINTWAPIARGYLVALADLGRVSEGRASGTVMLAEAKAAGLRVQIAHLHYAMAIVELAGSDYDAALEHLESIADIRERWPLGEVFAGACHELHARITIAKRDQQGFNAAAACCAESFMFKRNPVLIARYQRLIQDAERANLLVSAFSSQAPPPDGTDGVTASSELTTTTTESGPVFAECEYFEERVARLLSLATEKGFGEHAMLYIVRNNEPTLVAQRGQCPDTKRIDRLVATYLRGEIEEPVNEFIDPEDLVTCTVDADEWVGPTGAHFAPALLNHPTNGGVAITGVLVFDVEGQRRLSDSLLSQISEALAAYDDVVPITVKSRSRGLSEPHSA